MVTGDHPKTAAAIAAEVGIPPAPLLEGRDLDARSDEDLRVVVGEVSVFARATPEHKYRLVKALQENGEVVAVTGDGVNDSLALKGADIGIAMGIKGTDAAKEAADIVIADDNFITLGKGVFEGRRIFDNLSKGVRYYLSVKIALIAIFAASLVFRIPFPFSPIQIILLELFMDLGASASFVAEPAEPSIDRRPPHDPRIPFLDAAMIPGIAAGGFALWVAVFAPYWVTLHANVPLPMAQTYAFSAWMIGHVLLALFSRSAHDPLYRIGLFSNRVLLLWMAGALGFLATALLVPAVGQHLNVVPVTPGGAAILILFVILCMAGFELAKIVKAGRGSPIHGEERGMNRPRDLPFPPSHSFAFPDLPFFSLPFFENRTVSSETSVTSPQFGHRSLSFSGCSSAHSSHDAKWMGSLGWCHHHPQWGHLTSRFVSCPVIAPDVGWGGDNGCGPDGGITRYPYGNPPHPSPSSGGWTGGFSRQRG